MTLVLPCKICGRPFKSSDLYWVTLEPPDYEDLPEDGEHVDPRGDDDEPVIQLYYCEECLGQTALPPLATMSDLENAPEPHYL
jgi:hypothetical protein